MHTFFLNKKGAFLLPRHQFPNEIQMPEIQQFIKLDLIIDAEFLDSSALLKHRVMHFFWGNLTQ
jgi:sulfur relay (sulfurtransferase) DsrF/TusC family protein